MPRRSRSRSRSYSRSRSGSRSPARTRQRQLPYDAKEISEADYFLKIDEFKIWLKREKDKYFDELSGEKARRYFRKFVRAWNKGSLPKFLYAGVDPSDAPHTGYKWSFASQDTNDDDSSRRGRDGRHSSRRRRDDQIDDDEDYRKKRRRNSSSHRREHSSSPGPSRGGSGRHQGPTLPSTSDLTLLAEQHTLDQKAERSYERKRKRKENEERVDDMLGPRAVGKEGQLEKKRAQRESNRSFREGREDAGLEVDEGTLMGGGDSFKAEIARRDAAKARSEQRRVEAVTAARERTTAMREKESATMAMFQQLAKQRFG